MNKIISSTAPLVPDPQPLRATRALAPLVPDPVPDRAPGATDTIKPLSTNHTISAGARFVVVSGATR